MPVEKRKGAPTKPRLHATGSEVDWCGPRQLRRLLILASGTQTSIEIADLDEAKGLLSGLCLRSGENGGDLLGRAAAPTARIQELRRIKNQAKRLLKLTQNAEETQAVRLLYHVAVAAALGRLDVDISSRPLEERALLYERLALSLSGHDVGDPFRRAAVRVRERDMSSRKATPSDV